MRPWLTGNGNQEPVFRDADEALSDADGAAVSDGRDLWVKEMPGVTYNVMR